MWRSSAGRRPPLVRPRSPSWPRAAGCGSGTSARLALLHAAGRIRTGERFRHLGIVDTAFEGEVTGESSVGGEAAVVTEVEGSASLTGRHEFVLEPDDPVGTGFLLR